MISRLRARELLEAVAAKRILVVGDLMLDRYITGTVSRISPEAPVPVVLVTGERSLPGGAANVGLNVRSLGARAVAAGVLGEDRAGDDLAALFVQTGIELVGVIRSEGVQTTVKTRVVADRQQVVRVDRENGPVLSADVVARLCEGIAAAVRGVDGIVIEDYGRGVVCQAVVDTVLTTARSAGIPVGLDPKYSHELNISGVTLATPNYREALSAAGLPEPRHRLAPEEDLQLRKAGDVLLQRWKPDFLIVTMGPQGMYLRSGLAEPEIIPTEAREVFDVSGAGDTVIAVALLALAGGATHHEAASLANHAAGVVVGKLGTATCTPREILAAIPA